MRATGLDVTRADVVRILIKHALDATHCKIHLLFGGSGRKKQSAKRRR
jgi:hypothetical protein